MVGSWAKRIWTTLGAVAFSVQAVTAGLACLPTATGPGPASTQQATTGHHHQQSQGGGDHAQHDGNHCVCVAGCQFALSAGVVARTHVLLPSRPAETPVVAADLLPLVARRYTLPPGLAPPLLG